MANARPPSIVVPPNTSATRIALVNRLVCRTGTSGGVKYDTAADLRDTRVTNTNLIALLIDSDRAAKELGCFVLITMVRTGHHDDGPHGHFGGFAADTWLLNSQRDGDYVHGTDQTFTKWLRATHASPWQWQIILAGEAITDANLAAIAPDGFTEDAPDHVHQGAHS